MKKRDIVNGLEKLQRAVRAGNTMRDKDVRALDAAIDRLQVRVNALNVRLDKAEEPLAAKMEEITPAKPHKRRPRKKNGPVAPEAPKPPPVLDE